MCNYSITLFLYILKYFVRSSDVLLKKIYKYIPLLTFNSGKLVTLRGKILKKNSLTPFCKKRGVTRGGYDRLHHYTGCRSANLSLQKANGQPFYQVSSGHCGLSQEPF
jgi:hypothetical protein